MRLDRLSELATIMYHADAKRKRLHKRRFDQNKFKHNGCGTPSCSLGTWASHNRDRWRWACGTMPTLNGECDPFLSAAIDFEISGNDVSLLFAWNGCGNAKTARQASLYIKAFVRAHAV